jgi:hypothetical protein
MTKGIFVAAVAVLTFAFAVFGNPGESQANFHFMRIYEVMAGTGGSTDIQYVELRMTTGGQGVVGGHVICFYDAGGQPWAMFRFPANVSDATPKSILVGSPGFDDAWTVGAPDFYFGSQPPFGINTTPIGGGASIDHPIPAPSGKVAFGTDLSMDAADMCKTGFSQVDSVAYGTAYSGATPGVVDYPMRFMSDLPTAGIQELHLMGTLCNPCSPERVNQTNYVIADANTAGNQPRNNNGVTGPLPDADGDSVPDAPDLCPGTAPAAPVDTKGCSQAQVDRDTDGSCDPGAPGAGPSPGCTGTDNCPDWANPLQGLPPWMVPASDRDCDGFTDAQETFVETDLAGHCASTATSNDEGLPDVWPADFNDDQLVTGSDVLKFSVAYGSSAPGPPYTVRLDLSGNGNITGADILRLSPFFGKRCA